ncbi:polymorphic toxin type 44 domain-containing protein [Pseudomonas alliivorans]|nr:polymorphic toxin type 44 domain-containing protein [Pseudomonas alliivorans]MEE4712810.1 polymorphic toxin type 44 domain-containing protein [Pseudomonas alliivorans]MEE4725461.1 polymorphic toxin type 44 domain-containing protein [Pseudomonas alliivorans]MEE4765678.1 polymorphic toxin type 44 domain-containing protein [Pseudomonas alliivorans]
MIPSARQGDLHVCPIPGHLPTPIVSASGDVLANVMNVARVGDVCACGAVIVSGFPSILINGRPMAHLGSPTSHGGMIVNGSPDVVGGFNASNGGVVDFSRLGMLRYDGTLDKSRLNELVSDPELLLKAEAAGAVVYFDKHQDADNVAAICIHPDELNDLSCYIAGEINRNRCHAVVLNMRKLLDYDVAEETRKWMELPWYSKVGSANNPQVMGNTYKIAALMMWTEKVGQNRPWDHKPLIRKMYRGRAWHKQGAYMYFHDIWSNIHYGYVGMAAGLSEQLLLDGAGLEQMGSDTLRKMQNWEKNPGPHRSDDIAGFRAWDDAPDRISIQIGVDLYKCCPSGVSASQVMKSVMSVSPEAWGEGIRLHDCNNSNHTR